MTCPECGGKTRTVDSRPEEESVKRRRECLECGYRFSTVEIDADLYARLEAKKIPKNCTTCLYGRICGCANTDRWKDWTQYVSRTWLDNDCPSYYQDHKYKRAKNDKR